MSKTPTPRKVAATTKRKATPRKVAATTKRKATPRKVASRTASSKVQPLDTSTEDYIRELTLRNWHTAEGLRKWLQLQDHVNELVYVIDTDEWDTNESSPDYWVDLVTGVQESTVNLYRAQCAKDYTPAGVLLRLVSDSAILNNVQTQLGRYVL
jgi:hypothetical protein